MGRVRASASSLTGWSALDRGTMHGCKTMFGSQLDCRRGSRSSPSLQKAYLALRCREHPKSANRTTFNSIVSIQKRGNLDCDNMSAQLAMI